ncbi:MAG: glycosyltransferase family 2 protein [Planctomycetes bacterium]|nr:glycosyltransferase family 2 protein [Planctomycetota bacterium]
MAPPPLHFLTIVLNGAPFLRHHVEAFSALPSRWHWHVVEGVASLAHDTAWSLARGGRVDDALHRDGRSTDGTSEALDALARAHPGQITVYRKPRGERWDGKREMVSAPLRRIRERCLLWQVDVDELWSTDELVRAVALFEEHPQARAAFYRCHYFVGPDLVLTSRGAYGNGPYEWLRTWRYRPGDRWLAHEPPVLVHRLEAWKQWKRRRRGRPPRLPFQPDDPDVLSQATTEARGLVFQHLAYVLEAQVRWKEAYYGYAGAVEAWRGLQRAATPVRVHEHLPWVTEDAVAQRASVLGIVPRIPLPAPGPAA